MPSDFLLYGSTGFVGDAVARMALQQGLEPMVAGRNADKVKARATELGIGHRVFGLDDPAAIDKALKEVTVVLHCAGPYIYTSKPMADACLRTGTHYLDLTGEIPVYQALVARDAEAKAKQVMLLPGVGFDVVPTDCLALYLKQRLPSATRLVLAFRIQGPSSLPPGTLATIIELIPSMGGATVVRDGQLETAPISIKTRMIDFGDGPVRAMRLPWAGDVFMAFRSTGIPNIEEYPVHSKEASRALIAIFLMRPLLGIAPVRDLIKSKIPAGPTAEERAKTRTVVRGQVEDDQGHKAVSRLCGPEAGVTWTAMTALAAVRKVLAGHAPPGFQTPALAYGADFALECTGVTREDID
jgi:short subunit dehydrogenase-like uncharacterized protein